MAGQYYAHPRNQFWPIVGEIGGFDAGAPYARRIASLRAIRIAVWDVVASCIRAGSLDAEIDRRSIVVNLFAEFGRVCFNGRKAEMIWRRQVLHELPEARKLNYIVLPSTSPAHAGMSYARKLRAWRSALAA
jgi:hypoxanthine-DNA glycosylase